MAARLHRHESELGFFERAERAPHPALAEVVTRYTGFEHRGTEGSRRREVAQDQVTVILQWGPPLVIGGPGFPARAFGSFVAQLAGLDAWDARFALLDRWLWRHVADRPLPAADVAWAWSLLAAAGGGIPIAAVAAEIGCSRRHLEHRFREPIGSSPNTVARELAGAAPSAFVAALLPDGLGVDASRFS